MQLRAGVSISIRAEPSADSWRWAPYAQRSCGIHTEHLFLALFVQLSNVAPLADKLVPNLWIVWKTLDCTAPRLWITSSGALLSDAAR
jgi:hypothetical protein